MKTPSKLDLLAEGSINLSVLAPMIGANYYTLWRACSGKQVGTAALAKKIAKWAKCEPLQVLRWWETCVRDRIKDEISKL